MSDLDQMLNIQEKQKLENMYFGDKSRDASDKIRGFLFQDLVAINYLLDKDTESVCLEFLEDVDVFYSDGTLKIIQVKYYPNTAPKMKDIMTDLYYQYLRMKEFNLNMTIKPLLLIHREDGVTPLNLDKMLEYINCSKHEKPDKIEKPDDWFAREVYTTNKKEEQKREEYKKMLELLGYELEDGESEKTIYQKVHELAKDAPEITEFPYSLFVQKINSINSIQRNKKHLDLQKKLEESIEQNKNITKEQAELDALGAKAEQRANNIRSLVERLKAEEYNTVGPNLYKIYKKLSRINTIQGIQLRQEGELLSIVDESDKNIVNILSNGQLSVFMLAYFFAGIVSRNRQELCKIYFIDDLTACMDDVNMLAFLDLMKYQLSAKDRTIDQIFFASCDDRICKLLCYKLRGCNVEFCIINEEDFV